MTSSPTKATPRQRKPRPSTANLDEAWQGVIKGVRKPASRLPAWYFRAEYSVSSATIGNMKRALASLDRAGVSPIGSWSTDRATAQILTTQDDTDNVNPNKP